MSCLEKDPDRRPQDAGQLRGVLEGHQDSAPWSSTRANDWWRANLPTLSGALTFALGRDVRTARPQ